MRYPLASTLGFAMHASDRPDGLPKTEPALRAIAMPADANPHGDIFGGWLLSQMDLAGGAAASRRAKGRAVTVAITAPERIQRARGPGRRGAAERAGDGQRLGAHAARLEGWNFLRASVGRLLIPSAAGGGGQNAVQLHRRSP